MLIFQHLVNLLFQLSFIYASIFAFQVIKIQLQCYLSQEYNNQQGIQQHIEALHEILYTQYTYLGQYNKNIMAIIITDECINCGACEPECPNTAIYEAAVNWKYSDGTNLRGEVNLLDGKVVSAEVPQTAVNDEVYYIVPDKCTECKGFHDEPQCAAVCPVDCCIPDLNNIESESLLLEKQKLMHSNEINA